MEQIGRRAQQKIATWKGATANPKRNLSDTTLTEKKDEDTPSFKGCIGSFVKLQRKLALETPVGSVKNKSSEIDWKIKIPINCLISKEVRRKSCSAKLKLGWSFS